MSDDIQTIFSREPPLTDADLDRLIEHYRAARAAFNLGARQAGAAGKPSGPSKRKSGPTIELNDTDLLKLAPKRTTSPL